VTILGGGGDIFYDFEGSQVGQVVPIRPAGARRFKSEQSFKGSKEVKI
jgi:hypothetical protein